MSEQKEKMPARVDMSPDAIDRRLRDTAQLYALGMALREARLLGPVEEVRRRNEKRFDSERGQ